PRGHSVGARLLILEIAKGAIKSENLRKCQEDARSRLYEEAMGGFVRWMARDYECVRTALAKKVSKYRLDVFDPGFHARTQEIVANLQAGFELLLAFASDCGVVNDAECKTVSLRYWRALLDSAAAQAKHHAATEPVTQFIATLRMLLNSGRAHLA